MRFLIIIPAHNEEKNIFFCLKSLENQTFQNFEVVVVNDGSNDRTGEIAEDFSIKNHHFSVRHLETSEHEPGAKVVKTFKKGLEQVNLQAFDVICKFDADIIFPVNYLKEVAHVYQANPKAGMVSGLVFIQKKGCAINLEKDFDDFDNTNWTFENLSSKDHVRGPIKSYRRECLQQIDGLRPVLGWDNIDVMLAKMNGWEVITLKNIWVKHLRPTAYKYKNQRAKKLGEYFHNIGLSLPLAAVSSAKSAMKNRSFSEFFRIMHSFCRQQSKLELSDQEISFIRKLRWSEILKTFKK